MTDTRTDLLAALGKAVLEGEQERAAELANQSLDEKIAPLASIEEGLVPAIQKAGDLWEEGEYFLPELVTAAEAMKAAMAILEPRLERRREQAGRIVIGTVHGDIHDIGKTLVATMLGAAGYEVDDLGADVPVDRFVLRAKELNADIVCASALLTTTMTVQGEIVKALQGAGLRSKVLVGGAPVTRSFAEEIGANGYADNAVEAVAAAGRLIGS